MPLLPILGNHVLGLPEADRKQFFDKVLAATKAFALCNSLPKAQELSDELAFYKSLRGFIAEKTTPNDQLDLDQNRFMLKQLLDRAVQPEGVTGIFELAG